MKNGIRKIQLIHDKNKVNEISWKVKCDKKHGVKFPKEMIDRLLIWICNHLQTVNSTLTNDHSIIKYHIIGTVIHKSYSLKDP